MQNKLIISNLDQEMTIKMQQFQDEIEASVLSLKSEGLAFLAEEQATNHHQETVLIQVPVLLNGKREVVDVDPMNLV